MPSKWAEAYGAPSPGPKTTARTDRNAAIREGLKKGYFPVGEPRRDQGTGASQPRPKRGDGG